MAQALRFACQPGCTECCTQRGFVYLSEEDLVRAASFLKMTAGEFERRYVYRTRRRLRLRTPRDSRCHFLRGDGCSIHPAKPTQCRIFPFWPELVACALSWWYGCMDAADFMILLFAAFVDLGVLFLLRGMRRRDQVNERVKRSLNSALRYQRIE